MQLYITYAYMVYTIPAMNFTVLTCMYMYILQEVRAVCMWDLQSRIIIYFTYSKLADEYWKV